MGCSLVRMQENSETKALADVAERLRARFPDIPTDTVDEAVAYCHSEFDGHPIRDFVPVLVERKARDHLQQLRVQAPRPQETLAANT